MRSELMSRFNVPASTPNRTEQWAPEKGGNWGIVFDTMKLSADTPYFEFTGIYFYDNQGNPVWVTGSEQVPTAVTYKDGVLQSQPHCPACPKYLTHDKPVRVGHFFRKFEDKMRLHIRLFINMNAHGVQADWGQDRVNLNALAPPKE